tara:strand:+ start:215 stop:598 length:384 start_codon:yes stop_codon:yes gene_type:complete
MEVITITPSVKRPLMVKPKAKKVAKPIMKAKVTKIPKPVTATKGSIRSQYKYTGKGAECKTAQMEALIETVNEAKKSDIDQNSFTAQDLVKLAVKEGNLTTRQDPLRIFRFYQKRLVDEGYFVKVKA